MMKNNYEIGGIFPTPLYTAKRNPEYTTEEEKKEIEDIIYKIDKAMRKTDGHAGNRSTSDNTYIFDTKLKNLKEFCEEHIKIYVKEIIVPKQRDNNEVNVYITQSWVNVTRPGESLMTHWHTNSIISGVFYIATVEDDKIGFCDPLSKTKSMLLSCQWPMYMRPVRAGQLLLFPSWLEHTVPKNEKQTTNRISLSFNTFAKGDFGEEDRLNKLII